MAKQKTWQYVPNYVPTNASAANLCKNMIWFWTRLMLGDQTALTFYNESNAAIAGGGLSGQWFVWGSCDGSGGAVTTGGTSGAPATDLWGSTFNAAKIVQAAAGSNHSWFVLGSPTNFGGSGQGPFYLIIDCNSATNTSVSFYLCKTAPTGGSATARPTSTDEIPLITNPGTICATTTLNHHQYGILSTDGIFRIFQSRDGVGAFASVLSVDAFADGLAGDAWPVALLQCHSDNPSSSNWVYGCVSMAVNNSNASLQITNGVWRIRSADGSSIGVATPFVPGWKDNNGTVVHLGWGISTSYTQASNPQNGGKWDNVPFWGILGQIGFGVPGYRGRLYDVGISAARKWGGGVLGDGAWDPTNLYMIVGDAWQPAVVAPVM